MHSSREIKYYRIRLISQEMQRNAYNHVIRKSYPQHYLTAIFTISEHYICQIRAIRLFFYSDLGSNIFTNRVVRRKPDSFCRFEVHWFL